MFSSQNLNGQYLPIFLYVITLLGEINVPVFQAITQSHDAFAIESMLKRWVRRDGRAVDEMYIDQSSALLLAGIRTFTEYNSTNAYLDACFDALFNKEKAPRCYIRYDRSHFVNTIMKSKGFQKNVTSNIKTTFQRIFGFLIINDDISIAEKLITDCFIAI